MRRARILLAKPGLDGHDRGVKVVAMALRDAGAEVIYLGQRKTGAQIAAAARDEDVDVIGLSVLSGAHLQLTAETMVAIRDLGIDPVVVVGGTIPREDAAALKDHGVAAVFPAGSDMDSVVREVLDLVPTGVAGAE